MKIIKILCGRMFITATLILIQLAWFLVFWMRLTRYSPFISLLFTILSLSMVLYLIVKDDNPSFKMGWIIVLMALPLLGGLLYFFFGTKRPYKKLSRTIAASHENFLPYLKPNKDLENEIANRNERAAGSISYLQQSCSSPVWENTQTHYYPLGEEMYAEMLAELEKAQEFIFMEYFIIEEGEMWKGIHDILKKKAAQGLDVRLLYDDMGCLNLLPQSFAKDMEKQGIQCMPFNPFVPFLSLAMNNRDHRKITVIDGKVAFTGGINIADEYINAKSKLGHWKDTGIKMTGDAVLNFTLMFLEMWNAFRKTDKDLGKFLHRNPESKPQESDGFVLPFGDSPLDNETLSQNLYNDLLNQAKRYVYIFTPYLIIDDEMQNALRFAAKRGVDVRLVTPGIPDKKIVYRMTRSFYQGLLSKGVRIYEYTPGFLHAKSYVCDDELAVVGTINMDFRSLYLHFECGTLLYKTASVMQLKNDFLKTLEVCKEIKLENCKQGWFWKMIDSIIRVFAPLM